jgi:hypothetical protein
MRNQREAHEPGKLCGNQSSLSCPHRQKKFRRSGDAADVQTIKLVREQANPFLTIMGVIPT